MDILLDLRWMKPGYTGGIESLARAFVNTLLEMDYSNQYTVLIPSEVRFDFDVTGHHNFKFINGDGPTYFAHRLLEKLRLRRSDTGQVSAARHNLHCDIAISLAGYTHPDLLTLPTLLVIPDIQHEFFPQYFSPQELSNRQAAFNSSIKSARMICAISVFTRQTLIDKLQIPPEKITVTPLAADARITQPVSTEVQAAVLDKYALNPGYLFYPALTWPHKNHINLIRAMQMLRDQSGLHLELVCTGTAKEAQAEIQTTIQASGLADQIHFLGFVHQEDLGTLYRNAAVLVFSSMFEGFGMPVLEAMACGCPVVCSNTSSLPEVAGEAALYFDPQDPVAIAESIQRLLGSPELRDTLIQRGRLRAQSFTWERFTLQILQAGYCAANGFPSEQLLPLNSPWDAVEWQAILFPNQVIPEYRPTAWGKLKSAHRKLTLRWIRLAAESGKRRKPLTSLAYRLGAFLLSPRVSFISQIFPAFRDIFRSIRSKSQER